MNQREKWRDIKGYEGLYQVSNLGRIKSLPKKIKMRNQYTEIEMILKPVKDKYGYYHITLCKEKEKNKSRQIHRLVAETFIPNLQNKPQINHINGIKTDNRIENLEWVTAKENTQHMLKLGLKKNFRRKKINQYDLEGNFIKQWNSMTLASKCIGLTGNSHICSCCKGERKTAGGFIWRYADGSNK